MPNIPEMDAGVFASGALDLMWCGDGSNFTFLPSLEEQAMHDTPPMTVNPKDLFLKHNSALPFQPNVDERSDTEESKGVSIMSLK